jgi:hypothetical protein
MIVCLFCLLQIIFGVGSMVGAGVFVITGAAANGLAGPSVLLSYTVSGKDRSTDHDRIRFGAAHVYIGNREKEEGKNSGLAKDCYGF